MNERIGSNTENLEVSADGVRIFNFRHSKAKYGAYTEKVASDDPHGPIDPEAQPRDDLTPEGHELAERQANALFDHMNVSDSFFIVSSDQTRALQTAAIYARVGKERGFSIYEHDKTGSNIAAELGGGLVRSLDALSLTDSDTVADCLFNPPQTLPPMNWDAIDPETKERWERAREIILADDKGSWGSNFFAHSARVREFFPDMHDAQYRYDHQYKNLLRLAAFAKKKADGRRVNVLSFGHENYMGVALEQDTNDHTLPNCEAVELRDGKLVRLDLAS